MLINATNFPRKGLNLRYAGCSCCNPPNARRKVKKSAKQREKQAWKKEIF